MTAVGIMLPRARGGVVRPLLGAAARLFPMSLSAFAAPH
jgi:hypothetical protein